MSDQHNNYPLSNTNRWDTKQLVTMALMCAIGVALSFIEIPLFPAAPWLKYDPSAVPAMVCGFAYGPGAGIAVGFIGALVHALLSGNWIGAIMNIIVIIGCVLPSALIYKRMHTMKGAVIGLVVGIIVSMLFVIGGNLIFTPLFAGIPVSAVIDLIIPVLIPFNTLKAILNAVLTLIIYKSISNLITPKKKQVTARSTPKMD